MAPTFLNPVTICKVMVQKGWSHANVQAAATAVVGNLGVREIEEFHQQLHVDGACVRAIPPLHIAAARARTNEQHTQRCARGRCTLKYTAVRRPRTRCYRGRCAQLAAFRMTLANGSCALCAGKKSARLSKQALVEPPLNHQWKQ